MYKQIKSNGKVQFFESYYDAQAGKHRTVSVTMPNASRQSAKEAYAVLQEKIRDKYAMTDLTLSDLIDAYTRHVNATMRHSSAVMMVRAAESMKEVLGNPRLDDLTAGYITNRLDKLDKPAGYKNNKLQRWKTVLRWGYRRDYIQDISWIDKLERYREPSARAKVTDKYLETAELISFLEALEAPYEPLARLLVLSGLRVGEALAIGLTDLDVKNRVIHVSKTRSNGEVGLTKTDSSTRDVHMQPELYDLCKTLRKTAGVPFVFPFTYIAVHDAFARAGRKIGKNVTPHVLRHTHASMLFAKGFTMDEVAHRLGHSDSAITREIYVHLMEERRKAEADHLDAFKMGI